MKKLLTVGTVFTLALLLLSACTSTTQNSSPETTGNEPFKILATVHAPEASLANIETSPINYLKPKYDQVVVGAVQGQITKVDYTTITLTAGVDQTVDILLAVNVMTIRVTSSTFDAPKEIKVATSGGYLSPKVSDVYGKLSQDLGSEGVIEYESLGGAEPPVAGENVVLYLQMSSGGFAKLAPYSVIGASFGRYTLDSVSGKFSRKMSTDGDSNTFSKMDLTGDLLKSR